ncbi:MAG: glycosyltransferase family 39 protein [Candidatus Omnitrophota bacterium]
MRKNYFIAIILAIGVFVFLFGLGNMALTDPDETFYAESAKEMLNGNELITPLIFGKPQFEKPVFYYWLVISSYKCFGINEFAARFPSAIFGILGLIGVYCLARILFSPLCGFVSALVMASSAEYIILARACVTDMALMVFILFSLYFFLLGWKNGKKLPFLIASSMAALAVLTKGPIGLLIPGVIVFFYVLFTKQWKNVKNIPVVWSVMLLLAISLPWYILAYRAHGTVFINEFFGVHNITRFLKPEHRIGTSPFFYIPVVLGGLFPWSMFLPLASWNMFKTKEGFSEIKGREIFLAIWVLVVFLFFSASSTKLVTYIFPLFPATAIVIGRFWERFIIDRKNDDLPLANHMRISYSAFLFSGFLAAGLAFFLINHKYPCAGVTKGMLLLEAVLIGGLMLSLLFFSRGRKRESFFSIVFTVVFLCVPLVLYVLPVVGDAESSRFLSYKIKELAGPDDLIAGESDHRRGIAFYTDVTDVVDIHPYQSRGDFVLRKERGWGILQKKHYDQLKDFKDADFSEILSQSGKYVLFSNKPYNNEN